MKISAKKGFFRHLSYINGNKETTKYIAITVDSIEEITFICSLKTLFDSWWSSKDNCSFVTDFSLFLRESEHLEIDGFKKFILIETLKKEGFKSENFKI